MYCPMVLYARMVLDTVLNHVSTHLIVTWSTLSHLCSNENIVLFREPALSVSLKPAPEAAMKITNAPGRTTSINRKENRYPWSHRIISIRFPQTTWILGLHCWLHARPYNGAIVQTLGWGPIQTSWLKSWQLQVWKRQESLALLPRLNHLLSHYLMLPSLYRPEMDPLLTVHVHHLVILPPSMAIKQATKGRYISVTPPPTAVCSGTPFFCAVQAGNVTASLAT